MLFGRLFAASAHFRHRPPRCWRLFAPAKARAKNPLPLPVRRAPSAAGETRAELGLKKPRGQFFIVALATCVPDGRPLARFRVGAHFLQLPVKVGARVLHFASMFLATNAQQQQQQQRPPPPPPQRRQQLRHLKLELGSRKLLVRSRPKLIKSPHSPRRRNRSSSWLLLELLLRLALFFIVEPKEQSRAKELNVRWPPVARAS